ncbi:DNA-processing protein DprA [bacterium]|nr:DNA-processing protein DprA [bacterium]
MTNFTYESLLYMSCFGVSFSPDDLKFIFENHRSFAKDLVKDFRPELAQQFEDLQWVSKWEDFLSAKDRCGINFTTPLCLDYPEALRSLNRPPLFLSYQGQPLWKKRKLLSVVGSREPGRESLTWMSHHLPTILKEFDLGVISGGARGVDQWAHQISMLCQFGTLCVLPSGLLNIYPRSFQSLSEGLIERGGGLLSMYPLRQEMRKFFFHQRNHLIAALGEALLVVEAGVKSGSLVTTKQALDLGKDIYCLPFSPWSGRGAGNNQLIKEGATMVTSERDFIECFQPTDLFCGSKLSNSVSQET